MLDVVELAARGARDRLQELQVDGVGADPDGRDGDLGARERRDQLDVVLGVPVGVAVGQEDDVADAPPRLEEVPPGDVERVLEVRAAAVLDALDRCAERVAALAHGPQRAQLVGLGVEGDRRHQVRRAELVEDRDRGALRVLHLLAELHGGIAARVAHAVGAVDQQVERDRLARLRLGGARLERHGQHARERALGEAGIAEQPFPPGRDQRAAAGDVHPQPLERLVAEARARHVVEHDGVIVRELAQAGGEGRRRHDVDVGAPAREAIARFPAPARREAIERLNRGLGRTIVRSLFPGR